MPLSSPVAEVNLAGTNTTMAIGSVGSQVSLAVMDGKWTYEFMTDEMTNSTSGGCFEDVPTIKKASGTAKLAYRAGLGIQWGSVYPIDINTPSGPRLQCNARLNKPSPSQMNPKGGLTVDIEFTSQGSPITITGL
jgi:hypothetical protein